MRRLRSQSAQNGAVVDAMIPEPLGGAHRDWDQAAQAVKEAVARNLERLTPLSGPDLVSRRLGKYRRMGVYDEGIP